MIQKMSQGLNMAAELSPAVAAASCPIMAEFLKMVGVNQESLRYRL